MSKIKIPAARLSFPSLFRTATFAEQDTGKYEATFMLDKVEHKDLIEKIKGEINRMMKEDLKTKLPEDKICLKDGDGTSRDEYQGHYTIKASTKKRPLVIDRNKSPVTEEDNVIYSGVYVNAIISLWAQSNQFGKRINAQLDGVQFARDGEPFGEGGIAADAFDAFGSDDDDGFFD